MPAAPLSTTQPRTLPTSTCSEPDPTALQCVRVFRDADSPTGVGAVARFRGAAQAKEALLHTVGVVQVGGAGGRVCCCGQGGPRCGAAACRRGAPTRGAKGLLLLSPSHHSVHIFGALVALSPNECETVVQARLEAGQRGREEPQPGAAGVAPAELG